MTQRKQEEVQEDVQDLTMEETAVEETMAEAAEEAAEAGETERSAQQLTAELEDLNRKFLRVAADFDNYKRRTTLEREDLQRYSNAKLVGELLPVIDNFQLALKNASDSAEVQSFLKGVEMIYTQLMGILENEGLKKIEAVGEPFDPNRHEAIMQVPDEEAPEDTVVEELRSGYEFKDKVLRPSMVKVSTR